MADQSEVEAALVALASLALYPNGVGAPSVPGPNCRIYRGWPQSAALDTDLRAGTINVTVFAGHGAGRLTTRYYDDWNSIPVTPTLSVQVTGSSVSFAGQAQVGQLAGVRAGGRSYVYRIQPADNVDAIAANLAVLVRADQIVQLSGATLTIPGISDLLARVVTDAPATKETRRQSQAFRITCWCPTPTMRDDAAIAIDQSLAAVTFIDLPDGSAGRLVYSGTTIFDQSRDALLYRRDLLYMVEYATMIADLQPAMLFGDLQLNTAPFIA